MSLTGYYLQIYVEFSLAGVHFEYDAEKNKKNIEKHGISLKTLSSRLYYPMETKYQSMIELEL